jgi:NAD(P)-dependent dehydrogenase (short-subunit alcohol dehydrogenase family)
MDYREKVVIVTGSGKGIGHAVAVSYAQAGAKVIIAEKDPYLGRETEKTIVSTGGTAFFKQTDVSNPEDIREMVRQTIELYDKIDILINNAGKAIWKSPYFLTVEEWDEIMNTNLRSVFLCSREVAKTMKGRGGSIINIASTRAFMSEPETEAYAASKGGIIAITHALAASFAPDHIRVNCISPGWIETGDYNKLRGEDHAQHFSGRVGKPEDIASACLFLTDEKNDFIDGENLIIDGGMTRKMIYIP